MNRWREEVTVNVYQLIIFIIRVNFSPLLVIEFIFTFFLRFFFCSFNIDDL